MSDIKAEYSIEVDHASLAGHFPGNPVIPGVVILDKVIETLSQEKPSAHYKIVMTKFLKPLIPPATLIVSVTRSTAGRVNFTASVGDELISNGVIDVKEGSHV